MQRTTLVLLLVHVFVVIAWSNPLQGVDPVGNTIVPATPAELIDAIRTILDETNVPGVGLAIADRNEILLSEGIGLANVQSYPRLDLVACERSVFGQRSIGAVSVVLGNHWPEDLGLAPRERRLVG
jgi:hypothetical protein